MIADQGEDDDNHDRLEGEPVIKTGMVVIEFPSRVAAQAWYDDPDYQPLKELRRTGSQLDFVLVDGLDE